MIFTDVRRSLDQGITHPFHIKDGVPAFLVEFGCGVGNVTRALTRRVPTVSVP